MAGFDPLFQRQRTTSRYGWKPDLPDARDLKATAAFGTLKPVPAGTAKYSLRSLSPEVPWDQGQIGSCTGHGVGFCDMFARQQQGLLVYRPSRLAIYYGGRLLEGDTDQDSGAQIRDVMKSTAKVGVGPETLWPYDTTKFAVQPSPEYLAAAAKGTTTKYASAARNLNTFKQLIYNNFPVVMGFTVYESFESDAVAKSGVMPMPKRGESVLGGHCVVWIGWDDSTQTFETRNSWGTSWGDNGHFWMPYKVATNRGMSSDFWTIQALAA